MILSWDISGIFIDFCSFFFKIIRTRDYGRYRNVIGHTLLTYIDILTRVKTYPSWRIKNIWRNVVISKKAVKLANNVDRRPNSTDNSWTDNNLDDWIDKFHDLLGKKGYTEYL